LGKLKILNAASNQFVGFLPSELGSLDNLNQLDLGMTEEKLPILL